MAPESAQRDDLGELEMVLDRLVERLGLMPERHWVTAYQAVAPAMQELRQLSIELGDDGPDEIPVIAARAVGAQLSVIGRDFLRTAACCPDETTRQAARARALSALKRARSALP